MVDSLPEAALYYAERDFSVFPVRPRGKAPLIPKVEGGHGCKDATSDLRQVAELWKRYPNANIGMALGRASHDLIVLDIDGPVGQDSIRSRKLHIPETVVARTGRGWHYFFVAPGIGCRTGMWPNVDIKGGGGYVLVPPSIHPDGPRYKWYEDRFLKIPFAPAPEWLLAEIEAGGKGPSRTPEEWVALVHDGVRVGKRNDVVTSFIGKLLSFRDVPVEFAYEIARAFNDARCYSADGHRQEPLPLNELDEIFSNICAMINRGKA